MKPDHQPPTPHTARPSLLARLAGGLIAPSGRLSATDEQRQARLLAAFLLTLLVLALFGTILPASMAMSNPLEDPFTLVMAITSAVVALAYTLSRSRVYRAGALVAILALSALPFALALTRGDYDPARLPSIFAWLILPLLLGSIFLSARAVLLVAGANLAGLFAFSSAIPQVEFQTIFPAMSVQMVAAVLILVAIYQRNQLEGLRTADLSVKNQELEALRQGLEDEIHARTSALQRRLTQLRTAAEISQAISATLDLPTLLQQVVELVQSRFDLYYAGVFLVDPEKGYAVLKAGSGPAGMKMVAEGHQLAVGGASMVGWAIAHRQARIAQEVGQEAVHFNNPHLPDTQAELALPLVIGEEVIGALTAQSNRPGAFDQDDIAVLQSIADGLAVAINNARLFHQVQESLEEIRALHQSYLSQAWAEITRSAGELSASFERVAGEGMEDQTGAPLSVPLSLREQIIGQLVLEADRPDWSPEETAFVEAVTTQAAIALENARLLAETQRRAERERVVSEVSNKIWATTDIDTLLRTAIQEVGRVMNVAEGVIQLDLPQPNTGGGGEAGDVTGSVSDER